MLFTFKSFPGFLSTYTNQKLIKLISSPDNLLHCTKLDFIFQYLDEMIFSCQEEIKNKLKRNLSLMKINERFEGAEKISGRKGKEKMP